MKSQLYPVLPCPSRQQGVVIIIVLVILLIMTIIGVSAMGTATLEERMAGNFRDRSIAFQAAEATLREAERYIEETPDVMTKSNFDTSCSLNPGYCLTDNVTGSIATSEYWNDPSIWSSSSKHRVYSGSVGASAKKGKFIIEYLGNVCPADKPNCRSPKPSDPLMFRITSLGYGKNATTKTMLQSTYRLE